MTVQVSKYQRSDNTYIQGFGYVIGKPAAELKVGDVTLWNGGYTETVKRIIKESSAFVTVEMEYTVGSDNQVKRSERRLKKDRIVAMVQ